jgi:hypothetical protein
MYQRFTGPDGVSFGSFRVFRVTSTGNPSASGWYWQAEFPGCLPDGDRMGPFETREAAEQDANDIA